MQRRCLRAIVGALGATALASGTHGQCPASSAGTLTQSLDLASIEEIGAVYRGIMGRHYPAMALVEVSALLEPGAKVEIEGTAALPG